MRMIVLVGVIVLLSVSGLVYAMVCVMRWMVGEEEGRLVGEDEGKCEEEEYPPVEFIELGDEEE